MTLHKEMATGALWSLVEKGGQQALSFVVFFVLARILGPEEYGLANLCFIYFALSSLIILALVDGIVSLQIEDDLSLSSLFWSILAIGIGLSLFCAGTAAPLASFMKEPKLVELLYWFCIIPILIALSSVPNLIILKAIDLKIYAMRTIIATLADTKEPGAKAHCNVGTGRGGDLGCAWHTRIVKPQDQRVGSGDEPCQC